MFPWLSIFWRFNFSIVFETSLPPSIVPGLGGENSSTFQLATGNLGLKTFYNKKVLLRERKRHTAYHIASARYDDLSPDGRVPHPVLDGDTPSDVWTGSVPHPRSGWGGTPSSLGHGVPHPRSGFGYPRVPPTWTSDRGYPIRGLDRGCQLDGVPPPGSGMEYPPSAGWSTPPPPGPGMGYPPHQLDGVPPPTPHQLDGVPPVPRPGMGYPPNRKLDRHTPVKT